MAEAVDRPLLQAELCSCGGLGWLSSGRVIVTARGREIERIPCSCRIMQEDLARRQQAQQVLARARDEIGTDYAHCRFDTFDLDRPLARSVFWTEGNLTYARADQRKTLREVFPIVTAFSASPRGFLILVGPNGSGKTHLAAAWLWSMIAQGRDGRFLTLPNLFVFLKQGFGNEQHEERLQALCVLDALVINDISAAEVNGANHAWRREVLFRIIDERAAHKRPTMFTSNASMDNSFPPAHVSRAWGASEYKEPGKPRKPEQELVASDYRRIDEGDAAQ